MFVVGVLSIISIGAAYTFVRIKLKEWHSGTRMNRRSSVRKNSGRNNKSSLHEVNAMPNDVIELTDDDDDDDGEGNSVFTNKSKEKYRAASRKGKKQTNSVTTDVDTANTSNSTGDYQESDLNKNSSELTGIFDLTTDSLSDETDEGNNPSVSALQARTRPLFTWDPFGTHGKSNVDAVNNVIMTDDSDSGEAENTHNTKGSYRGQHFGEKKRQKFGSLNDWESPPKEDCQKTEELIDFAKELPELSVQYEKIISGVRVSLPVQPYPSQIAVMNRVIQGCLKKQNCLLESPTGSGKTLALLCGALAWQNHFSVELEKEKQKALYEDEVDPEHPHQCKSESLKNPDAMEEKHHGSLSVPKIYYGTRTHKQIEQVIRELRKTVYRCKKMTILSSREHTCIRTEERNKTELCNELLDPAKFNSCHYYNELKKNTSNPSNMSDFGMSAAWDIEDIVKKGRKHRFCPYFAAKNLMQTSDIIFCPYNYLIDPDIRESMQINLKNEVVILDEAHNIEDTCREAASVELRYDHIMSLAQECRTLMKTREFQAYNTLNEYSTAFAAFLQQIEVTDTNLRENSQCSVYWTGEQLIEMLNMFKIGLKVFPFVLGAGQAVLDDFQKAKDNNRQTSTALDPVISQLRKNTLEHLMFVIRMLQSKNYVQSYRACVTENMVNDCTYISDNQWVSVQKKDQRVRALKLLCMNPAVIFVQLSASARSIILASGTLTPTSSFQSELDTEFPQMLNANHVIQKDQIYVTCINRGPTGIPLRATYSNVNQFNFQDELGRVLLDVCTSVPYGVLCFFSSYHMMETQIRRWKLNSTWCEIEKVKAIFIEPRYSFNLAKIMEQYRTVIRNTSKTEDKDEDEDDDEDEDKDINGALFLAVFRGKVAEGIDFSDNEARCVVTVGIPYAVRNDPAIKMKMEYNSLNLSKGLLDGSEWYTIQAFRALNQALGRCIRHKNDWGAVLLVDERLKSPDCNKYLPKWIKTMTVDSRRYNIKEELQKFVAKRLSIEQNREVNLNVK